MLNLENLINFFSTKFYNNLKYSNSFIFLTRIFFERTTKYTTTVSNLGNVYRNSKWADLRVLNIKGNFLSQFFKNFVIFFLGFIIVYTVVRWSLSLFSIEISSLSQIWFHIIDSLHYAVLVILRFIYLSFERLVTYYSTKLHKMFFNNNQQGDDQDLTNNKLIEKKKTLIWNLSKELNINLANNPILPKEKLLYLWSCQKCTLWIQRVDAYIDFNSFDHSNKMIRHLDILQTEIGILNIRTLIRVLYMEALNSVKPEPTQNFYLGKSEKKYFNFLFLKKFNLDPSIAYQAKTTVLNYNTLKKLNILPKKVLMDNIEKNISLTKQNRWAWKSSILSDNFLVKNLSMTNLRKTLGTNPVSNSTTKHNIWFSNKINHDKNFIHLNRLLSQATPNVNNLQQGMLSNVNLNSLNFSESSINWVAKRFFLLQNMNLNFLNIDHRTSNHLKPSKDDFEKSLTNFESLGTNNLVLLFNSLLGSNVTTNAGLLSHYDLKSNNNLNFLNLNSKVNEDYTKYLLDFADQVTLSTPLTIRFASHFSNTIVFDKNSLILFSNFSSY